MKKIALVGLLFFVSTAHAQLFEPSVRTGVQTVTYKLGGAFDQKINEFIIPMATAFPIGSRLTVDVASAYASVVAKSGTKRETISGFTDTQLRLNLTLGQDAVVLTAGINLPTGEETVGDTQLLAAGLIGNDFLAFPISNLGTGLAATGGLAVAKSFGEWNVGLASGFRRTSTYEPARIDSTVIRFTPGDEYRFRLGADRSLGPGQFSAGLTFSTFAKDVANSFTYNTGDRYISQISYYGNAGETDFSIYSWDLYRTAGLDAAGGRAPVENIVNIGGSLGFDHGIHWEPNIEGRTWRKDGHNEGVLATLGLRTRMQAGPISLMPSISYTGGSLYVPATTTTTTTTPANRAPLKGWNGTFTIRIQSR